MQLYSPEGGGGAAPGPPLGFSLGIPPANNPPKPGGPAPTGGALDPPGTGGALAMPLSLPPPLPLPPPAGAPDTVGADLSFV